MPETTEPAATTPKTWPVEAFPPAKELADWLRRCTAAEREQFATQAVQDAETAHTCRVAWHREQLAAMLVDSAGKVVVLRGHEDWAESVDVHEAVQPFLDAGAVSVLVLVPDASIDTLDEEQMRSAGWVRVDKERGRIADEVLALTAQRPPDWDSLDVEVRVRLDVQRRAYEHVADRVRHPGKYSGCAASQGAPS